MGSKRVPARRAGTPPAMRYRPDHRPYHACGAFVSFDVPRLWFPDGGVHTMTQTLAIFERTFCCGAMAHTEPVAMVGAYLHPVKQNARLVCNLMNQHRLAGRSVPSWLVMAWDEWDADFVVPSRRDVLARERRS